MSQHLSFRPDIEGLRAVAVGVVLLYHAQVDLFAGGFLGVDVFFVLSGFLITRSLVAETARTGTVHLRSFYARRVRRLLPAAALVLVTTAAAVRVLLPVTTWRDLGLDVVAAAGYVVNWRLSARAVDYLAEDVVPSPVQHFWSLSVEEQFYFLWPVLVLVAARAASRRGWRLRPVLAVVFLLGVAVPSLALSAVLTDRAPALAFFHTGTRMWELAAGGLCALLPPIARGFAPRSRMVAKGLSLLTLIAMAVLVSADAAWPGVLALGAVLPTTALILLGHPDDTDWVHRTLALRPMQLMGAWSYSLYLWHWPPLAVLAARWGELTTGQAVVIVVISVVPAVVSYYAVESPIRFGATLRRAPGVALGVGANLTLLGVAVGLALHALTPIQVGVSTEVVSDADSGEDPPTGPQGPALLAEHLTDEELIATLEQVGAIVPAPTAATADIPRTYPDGCHVDHGSSEPVLCDYGDVGSDVHVALVGDSKAGQWATALIDIAERREWRFTNITKSTCELSTSMPEREGEPDAECLEWGRRVVDRLRADTPDLVLVSQVSGTSYTDGVEDPEAGRDLLVHGMVEAYEELERAGSSVAIVLDNPSPGLTVYECVATHSSELERCTFTHDGRTPSRTVQREAARLGGFPVIDMWDLVCPTATCLPVIGDVLVYRQGSHLTATYIRALAPAMEDRIRPLLRGALAQSSP